MKLFTFFCHIYILNPSLTHRGHRLCGDGVIKINPSSNRETVLVFQILTQSDIAMYFDLANNNGKAFETFQDWPLLVVIKGRVFTEFRRRNSILDSQIDHVYPIQTKMACKLYCLKNKPVDTQKSQIGHKSEYWLFNEDHFHSWIPLWLVFGLVNNLKVVIPLFTAHLPRCLFLCPILLKSSV